MNSYKSERCVADTQAPCFEDRLHLIDRIPNAAGTPISHPRDPNSDPAGRLCDSPDCADLKRPPQMAEYLATDFKRLRNRGEDATRHPIRVANYACEMDAGYINLYGVDLADDLQIRDGGGIPGLARCAQSRP